MSYNLFQRLGIGKPEPTPLKLQLADRSVVHPCGVIRDVLIKVSDHIYPVNFVILDAKNGEDVPLILGRPFLATAKALINVGDGELVLQMGDTKVTLYNSGALKDLPVKIDTKHVVNAVYCVALESVQEQLDEIPAHPPDAIQAEASFSKGLATDGSKSKNHCPESCEEKVKPPDIKAKQSPKGRHSKCVKAIWVPKAKNAGVG